MPKIKKITVSNLKAISSLTVEFNGCTAIITAGNNKGKSTFLKSLPERLQGLKPNEVLKHGEKDGFAEWELTTGEKFVWTFKEGKEKLTFITEKNISTSVTKEISKSYFPAVFNVDEFLNSAPKKQRETLQKLTGIDFTEIDKLYQDAYESRTYANKRLSEEKAKLVYYDPKLTSELIDVSALQEQINNAALQEQKLQQVKQGVKDRANQLVEIGSEIADLEAKIVLLKSKKNAVESDIKKGNEWVLAQKTIDVTSFKETLAKSIEQNKVIEENNKAKLQQEIYDKALLNAQEADAKVKSIEAEKIDVIKNANMPTGFGFSEDGITYNGFAFNKETLSSSAIYIAALKLAALQLGEVKTLHFDASYLDKNSLLEIESWANEQDLQLLIERPDFEAGEIEYQIIQHA